MNERRLREMACNLVNGKYGCYNTDGLEDELELHFSPYRGNDTSIEEWHAIRDALNDRIAIEREVVK